MKKFITNRFEILSEWISVNLGSPYAFMFATMLVIVWAVSGPFFQYSDTWQLVINTGTTICTFLMVFLLQNTGNRTIDEMQERLREMELLNRELLMEIRDQRALQSRRHPQECSLRDRPRDPGAYLLCANGHAESTLASDFRLARSGVRAKHAVTSGCGSRNSKKARQRHVFHLTQTDLGPGQGRRHHRRRQASRCRPVDDEHRHGRRR